MWTTEILLILSALLLFVYVLIKYMYTFWKRKGIPHAEPLFFFGNVKDTIFKGKILPLVIDELYKKFQKAPMFGVYNFMSPILIVKDPELIKLVMVKDFQYFHDRGALFDPKSNPLAEHLVFLSGNKWKILRSKLSPTFTSGKMKMMFPFIEECAVELIKFLDETIPVDNEVDIKDVVSNFTTDAISSCAFGLKANSISEKNSNFKQMGAFLFNPTKFDFYAHLVVEVWPKLLSTFSIKVLPKKNEDFFLSTIKETIKLREKNNIQRPDFLQLLIQLKNHGKVDDDSEDVGKERHPKESSAVKNKSDDIEITDNLLAAQAFAFLVAGLETSSGTLGYCLHSLALNQDIQDKLREEINMVMQKHGGFSYAAISDMKYMDMIIEETLRMYPIIHFLPREVTKPYTFPGTNLTLPAGFKVRIPVFSIHRDAEYYPDPLKFDPERFSEENKSSRPQYTYLPFGDGPRICIGMRFAYLQMRAALTKLISNYKFETCPRTEVPITFNRYAAFSLQPSSGVWLKLTKLK